MTLFESRKPKRKAFAYYRHSTKDRQINSIPIQRERTIAYADKYDIEIVHEEMDRETGLVGPDKRLGFGRVLDKIKNPECKDVEFVLVFDESRWGRFENDNAAPHYEFLCNEEGKHVIYTADDIPPEAQITQMGFKIYKDVKRKMASEYSRELSNKV